MLQVLAAGYDICQILISGFSRHRHYLCHALSLRLAFGEEFHVGYGKIVKISFVVF